MVLVEGGTRLSLSVSWMSVKMVLLHLANYWFEAAPSYIGLRNLFPIYAYLVVGRDCDYTPIFIIKTTSKTEQLHGRLDIIKL